MNKLDKKDYRILFELDRNSRQSINELAKGTALSRDIVAYRMKQLEKAEIIEKYITIIDFTKFGFQIVRLYLKLQNTTPEIEQKMISFFMELNNSLTIYQIDGYYNIAVGLLVRDFFEYKTTEELFLQKFRSYIIEKQVSIFLDYIHYSRNYLVEKKHHDYTAISTGSFKPFQYDEKDLELLNYIKENARMTLLELADKLRMTATGVKYKLKNLEKNKVIVAYKILLNAKALANAYYKVDLQLEDLSIISGLNHYLLHHPNIIYQEKTIGGSDFEFDIEIDSKENFYRLLEEIKSLFPQKIRTIQYYQALKIYKYSYFPEEFLNQKTKKLPPKY